MISLKANVAALKSHLPELERKRNSGAFANDVYEAVDDWCHLGDRLLENDTRVNYPARARSEFELWAKLQDLLHAKSPEEQQRYVSLLEVAQELLKRVETTQPSKDGHLGVLRVLREHFGFLRTEYGFEITDEQPIGARFSSGAVYVKLEYSKNSSLSCSFGPESKEGMVFWVDDLLFLYGDSRYRTLPQSLTLDTESDVESWFRFVAEVFRQYGREVLSNQPGVFDRLAKAQAKRDAEYTEAMNEKYGKPL